MIKEVFNQINTITRLLIQYGLSVSNNFPKIIDNSIITWTGNTDYSLTLKNLDYKIIYSELDSAKSYNIKMLDGGIIQIEYTFDKGKDILKSRLAFFPSPILEKYDNDIEGYETSYYGETVYGDILEKYIISFPIRIDYAPKEYKDIIHPSTHIHLGGFERCRIPLVKPIMPYVFIEFILRNFYNSKFLKHFNNFDFTSIGFENTISNNELKILHFSIA